MNPKIYIPFTHILHFHFCTIKSHFHWLKHFGKSLLSSPKSIVVKRLNLAKHIALLRDWNRSSRYFSKKCWQYLNNLVLCKSLLRCRTSWYLSWISLVFKSYNVYINYRAFPMNCTRFILWTIRDRKLVKNYKNVLNEIKNYNARILLT